MLETNIPSGETAQQAPKRRKVRKGTQSCWECKRRKTRCTYVDPTQPVCDGCRSRKLKCVSQELDFEEERPKAGTKGQHLVEHLPGRATGLLGHNNAEGSNAPGRGGSGSKTSPIPSIPYGNSVNDICNALVSAWPSQHDLDIITTISVGTSVLFHGTVCMPYSTLLDRETERPKDILQLPSPGSHPVLLARKLLMLGTFLQGIPPGAFKDLSELDCRPNQVMSHVVDTANKLVTCNDDLVDSLEGIECIMIESMYQNNAGSLRRAWLLNRRAMTLAQMMGLHTGHFSSAKILDSKTRDRIDPQYMWIRLVISDRYLSLMLGLPQGSPESPFATTNSLQRCEPLDRMEQIETKVGGLILQRNRENLHDLDSTRQIDKLMQDAAASMPPQWWLIPDISALTGSDTNGLSETLRLMLQFTHYHLLAQLHLPYLLQPSTDRRYDYSKITAVNASREILSRFVLFRGAGTIPAYCRGIDFLAFVASTVLSLAHIECRRQEQTDVSEKAGDSQFFKHQRPGDRGLLERMLSIMERMAEGGDDAISRQIANILQQLLEIEGSDPQEHLAQTIISPETMMPDFPCSERTEGVGTSLSIQVPYFGTIRIERSGEPKLDRSDGTFDGNRVNLIAPSTGSHSTVDLAAGIHGGVPADPAYETASPRHEPAKLNEGAYPRASNKEGQYPESIDLGKYVSLQDLDDWAFQGVDTALFNSLLRGSEPAMDSSDAHI